MQKIGGQQGIIATALRLAGLDGLLAVPVRCIVVPFGSKLTGVGTEVTTGLVLPLNSLILPSVGLNVRTAEAVGGTKTLKLGTLSSETNGAADAFLNGLDISSTGMKFGSLANGAETLGTKLKETTSAGPAPKPYGQEGAGKAVSISATAGSADWTAFAGEAYLFLVEPFT